MQRANETRHIKWHKIVNVNVAASVCNNKQTWNEDKCRCEWKKLIDKGMCVIKDLFGILVIVINHVIL